MFTHCSSPVLSWRLPFALLLLLSLLFSVTPLHAKTFGAYKSSYEWSEVFPGADRFGPLEGTPPAVEAFKGEELLGYAFVASDVVRSIGYSGKPIGIAVGIDLQGDLVGLKLIEHQEPILLIGIQERKLFECVEGLAVGIRYGVRFVLVVAFPRFVGGGGGAEFEWQIIEIPSTFLEIAKSHPLGVGSGCEWGYL